MRGRNALARGDGYARRRNALAVQQRETETNRLRAGAYDYLTSQGLPPASANALASAAEFMPGVGDVSGAEDTYQAARSGNYLAAGALGAATLVGLVPGVGDAASAGMKRALKQGYDGPFYRGESTGVLPSEYPGGAHFARDPETAGGHASRGDKEAREFMLRFNRPLSGQVTLGDWADLVEAASSPSEAQRIVNAAPIDGDWTPERFVAVARKQADEPLMNSVKAWHLLGRNSDGAEALLKRAGFDGVDTGRGDVLKLDGYGIREKSAAFDPAKMDSRNIFSSMAGLVGAGALAGYSTQDQRQE